MNDEKTQAAVERLEWAAGRETWLAPSKTVDAIHTILTALDAANERAERAEVALDMKIGTCIWIAEDEDSHYEGTCGVAWWLMDGDTKDHQVNFCPRCGGRVKEATNE